MPSPLARWLPVVLWAAVIFALSSVPDLGTGLGGWDLVLRKVAHTVEYAILGALLLRALRGELPALAVGIAYALSDELHQHFVPGRRGAPLDVLIDSIGVVVGVIAWRRLARALDSRHGREGDARPPVRGDPGPARPDRGGARPPEPSPGDG